MATTPKGYHYPAGTERVMDGDDVIAALATDVDTMAGLSACGEATLPIVSAGTPAPVTVTFPVGRFTVAPQVQATMKTVNVAVSNGRQPIVESVALASCIIRGARDSGTATFNVYWWAVQL